MGIVGPIAILLLFTQKSYSMAATESGIFSFLIPSSIGKVAESKLAYILSCVACFLTSDC